MPFVLFFFRGFALEYEDGIVLSKGDVQKAISDYCGEKNINYPDAMLDGMRLILSLPPQWRKISLESFGAFICTYCGGPDLHCQCWNDE